MGQDLQGGLDGSRGNLPVDIPLPLRESPAEST